MADSTLLAINENGDLNPVQAEQLENQLRAEGYTVRRTTTERVSQIQISGGG